MEKPTVIGLMVIILLLFAIIISANEKTAKRLAGRLRPLGKVYFEKNRIYVEIHMPNHQIRKHISSHAYTLREKLGPDCKQENIMREKIIIDEL